MRRTLVVFALLAFACRQERPAPPSTSSAAKPGRPAEAAKPVAPVLPKTPNKSTPDRCAGDGGYAQAVDCYRQTSRLEFTFDESNGVRADGEMTRSTIGAEQLRFTLHGAGKDDGEWQAAAKTTGVVWTRRGQRVTNEPQIADRIWQRTTLYIDPQKKEGEPVRDGTETVEGQQCARYHFTDANSGDRHDVWVSLSDGHVVKIVTEGKGPFPGYSLVITKAGA